MRASLILALALALPVLGTGEARSAASGGLGVLRASVRFGHDGRATLRVVGDLSVQGDLPTLDPRAAGLRISLGPHVILDGLPEEARVRVRRNGDWRVSIPRAFEGPSGRQGRMSLDLNPSNGTFALLARGWDGSALLAAGPTGVPCSASAGMSSGEDSLDFVVRGRLWTFRNVTPPGHGPGPGGGGGGPPTPVGITTIAQGPLSGIQSYRFEVIGDDAAWQSLWLAHAGSGPAPPVNFQTEMVVGIWLGMRTSGGYTATIASITPATVLGVPCFDTTCPPQGVVVTVIESVPGGSCAVPGVITYPHHIVRVPRQTWGGAMVEIATRVDDCF